MGGVSQALPLPLPLPLPMRLSPNLKVSQRTRPLHHRRQPRRNNNNHRKNISEYNPRHGKRRGRRRSTSDENSSLLPLRSRNPRSIYKDIQRFARHNDLKKALTIMDYMDQKGIPVDPTTFSVLIAACIRSKSLPDARQIHAHILINGLENDEFLRMKLVHMYTACSSLDDAKRVFKDISYNRSTACKPWKALLKVTVMPGGRMYENVLSAYAQMRELGVRLDVQTFSIVIKSFARSSALKEGLKVHSLLVKNGLIHSSLIKTTLLGLYFKCGKIRLACKVFDEILERDIVLWGAMIAGFAHNRLQREALDYVRWMVSEGFYPNSVVLTTILPVIGEICARRLGQEVHCYALKMKNNYLRQLPIQSGLIDMYCKCGDMGSGRKVLYGSMERNPISWTALMSGYMSNGMPEQALRSVVWMQQEGFLPDVITVTTIIPVCAELRALMQGKEIHAYAMKNLFLPNVSVTTSLIKMYSNCGVLDYSVKLFEGMTERNVISWTAMIDSYAENGCIAEALTVFRSMSSSKHRPDSVVIARMLSVCGANKVLKLGKEIHGHVLKKNFLKVPFVSAEVVKMYGSCGSIRRAKSVFNAVPVKGSITWTAIIETYGYNNLWRDAIDLFDEMISRGFTPNDFTFKVVLGICDEAGFADDAYRIIKLMSQRSKISKSEAQLVHL